ncbi:hypothetical protein DPMN_140738 [Dreissena polymorpha]|uniref:Uncharacterized protein n=1 Tax=Dreissena polymorpha TaxID=45954 RepID=A0A9D4GAZ9_DREPO|nr:hypothetical protein DPMN_140738 [Dreissena polymorpha]
MFNFPCVVATHHTFPGSTPPGTAAYVLKLNSSQLLRNSGDSLNSPGAAATHSDPPVLWLFISPGTAAITISPVPRLLTQLPATVATH